MNFKKLPLALLIMVLAAALLAACAPTPAAPEEPAAEEPAAEEPAAEEEGENIPVAEEPAAEGEKVFTVGILAPFTGPSARTGDEFRTSAEMAFEDIDYTIGDYTIEVVWVDSQSDPERATRAYEEAIVQHGVQALALNWHSSVSVACMDVAAKHHVPHIFAFGATEVVNEKFDSDPEKYAIWSTKGWPQPMLLSQNYVTALTDAIEAGLWEPNMRAAIYGEDTDWGRSFGDGIASQLEEAGWEVVDYQYFPIEQTEFTSLIERLKNDDVDLIAGTSTAAPSFTAFIKQADELGLESLIIADGLGWVGEWYDLTGSSSDYVIDQIPGWTTEAGLEFAERFQEKSGLEPSPSSGGLAFDGTNVFITVMQAAYDEYGELTSETVQRIVEEKIWTGELTYGLEDGAIVMAEYNWSNPPDPLTGKGYYTFPVLQYHDGVGATIWPPEFQNADLEIPFD